MTFILLSTLLWPQSIFAGPPEINYEEDLITYEDMLALNATDRKAYLADVQDLLAQMESMQQAQEDPSFGGP